MKVNLAKVILHIIREYVQMTVGVYDTTAGVEDLQPKVFPTQQAMLAEWTAGHLTGIVDSSCPSGGLWKADVGDNLVVAIDKVITDKSFSGRTFAASPELRDTLALKVTESGEIPSDIGLLTQQQYLADPGCVDIYLTSIRQGSSTFFDSIGQPFYVKQLPASGSTLHAENYQLSFNVSPVTTDVIKMSLYVHAT